MTRPGSVAEESDWPLLEAVRRGEPAALERLIARHGRWVRAVVYGLLDDADKTDEVLQQVWTTVWRRVGSVRQPGRWCSWLYRLARNAAIDAGKAEQRHQQLRPGISRAVDARSRPDQAALVAEQHRRVLRAIRALPAIYREPFVLRHLEDWSYAQIAEVLELPVATVETRLVRARRLLREALEDQDE